jgi:hypothetical protein
MPVVARDACPSWSWRSPTGTPPSRLQTAKLFSTFISLVSKKLRPRISYYFSDHPNLAVVLKSHSYQVDAGFGCCSRKFSARKNESRAIVENRADLFAIQPTGVPVKMNRGEAMFSFISDPGLSAFLLSHWLSHSQEGPGGLSCAVYACCICARLSFPGVLLQNIALCRCFDYVEAIADAPSAIFQDR